VEWYKENTMNQEANEHINDLMDRIILDFEYYTERL